MVVDWIIDGGRQNDMEAKSSIESRRAAKIGKFDAEKRLLTPSKSVIG